MKGCPVDTYANNCPGGYRLLNRGLFAHSPIYLDNNTIRDGRWWNTSMFFKRMYREAAGDFRFCVRPKTQ